LTVRRTNGWPLEYSRALLRLTAFSSRQLARACEERVDMMAVTGLNQPDFRTISDSRNFTDGDSRIMPSQGGFIAGYNGQIAVDAAHQIIVAQQLGTNPADFAALIPLVDQARANLGRKLRKVSGDTGFATEANLEAIDDRRVTAYPSPGRIRHGDTDPTAGRLLVARQSG